MPRRRLALILPVLALISPFGAARAAVTEGDFQVRSTAELVNLCTAGQGDPLVTAAIHFCEGFLVGAYRTLSEAQSARPHKLFCITGPMPTRDQATAAFAAWARATPSVMSEQPSEQPPERCWEPSAAMPV